MATGMINVLAIVDTTSIMSQGGNTWYLVDDDSSSSGEGSQSLNTSCSAGDTLYFRVTPAVEGSLVAITAVGAGPTGAYVFGYNQPVPPTTPGGPWSWQTENQASGSYALHVLISGTNSVILNGYVTAGPPSLKTREESKASAGVEAQRHASAPKNGNASKNGGGKVDLVHNLIDIVVAADTQAILAGAQCEQGNCPVYMVDNNPKLSQNEGSSELNTSCNAGDTLRWHIVPINGTDTVTITGFQQMTGNVFGPNSPIPAGNEFTWLTANQGSETYEIRILVNGVQTFEWDPYITVNAPQPASKGHKAPEPSTVLA